MRSHTTELKDRIFHLNSFIVSVMKLEQVAQKGYGVYIFRESQNISGHIFGPPAIIESLLSRGFNRIE